MGNRHNVHMWTQAEMDRQVLLKGAEGIQPDQLPELRPLYISLTVSSLQKSIALPEKIKCGRCFKNLNQAKYSKKQRTDARYQIKTYGKIIKAIYCTTCTGQQVVEIECTMCSKTKGLEEFAKSQRNPDTARCFECTEDQVSQEAISDEKYEDPKKAFITPDHSAGNYPEYFSSATSTTGSSSNFGDEDWKMVNGEHDNNEDGGIALSRHFQHSVSINGSADETLLESEFAYPAAGNKNGNGDGQWSEVRTRSWHTQSTGPASAGSGFDPNKYGKRSTTSIAGSVRSFTSSVAERSVAADYRSNGWVKKSAIPRGTSAPSSGQAGSMRPMGDGVRERESVVNAWSSDEEEGGKDDDEDDDSDDDTQI